VLQSIRGERATEAVTQPLVGCRGRHFVGFGCAVPGRMCLAFSGHAPGFLDRCVLTGRMYSMVPVRVLFCLWLVVGCVNKVSALGSQG